MKFNWFHLMPYRYLPDDFKEAYPSVWVDIPSSLFEPEKGHWLYNDYLDELEFADRMGFDAICVNEHHQNGYGLMPSPNLMAAAMIRRTSRAAICVMGNSIALYNPPVRVAEEFAMLDVMSGGRLIAGFPVGTAMDSNFCYGQTPATLRDKYAEAHDLIMRSWTEPEPFTFNGKYTQLRYVNVWPRPVQQPHPPVWIPGGGSLETWDFCADNDYNYSYLSYFGYKRAAQVMKGYWDKLDEKGKDVNPYRGGFAQVVAVAETDALAEKEYGQHLDYFFNRCLHVPDRFADAPGYRTQKTVEAGLKAQVGSFADMLRAGLTWKDLVDLGFIIAGSPATVREQLREAIKDMHVGQLMTLQHFGNIPHELTLKNTKLFAEQVMPDLRDLWSDWEDHWSPKPMAETAQTRAQQAL